MTVYIRTAAGTAAALNPLTKMPRHLRQLLVSIDGLTPASTFAMRMARESDIDVLLEALQRAGLIRRVGPAGLTHGNPAVGSPQADTASSYALRDAARSPPPSPGPSLAIASSLAPSTAFTPVAPADVQTARAAAQHAAAAAEEAEEAELTVRASADLEDDGFDSFGDETAPAGLRSATAGSYELGNLISLMSNFVTQHLPDRALEIVLALESLTSVGQVVSGLHDYRALIAPTGDAAHRHLAELQHLLESS